MPDTTVGWPRGTPSLHGRACLYNLHDLGFAVELPCYRDAEPDRCAPEGPDPARHRRAGLAERGVEGGRVRGHGQAHRAAGADGRARPEERSRQAAREGGERGEGGLRALRGVPHQHRRQGATRPAHQAPQQQGGVGNCGRRGAGQGDRAVDQGGRSRSDQEHEDARGGRVRRRLAEDRQGARRGEGGGVVGRGRGGEVPQGRQGGHADRRPAHDRGRADREADRARQAGRGGDHRAGPPTPTGSR